MGVVRLPRLAYPSHTLLPLCSPGIMNSSNCSSWDANPVYYTYMGGLLALGLLLNGLALWVLCWRLPRWTETRIYMANLAVADLCLL